MPSWYVGPLPQYQAALLPIQESTQAAVLAPDLRRTPYDEVLWW